MILSLQLTTKLFMSNHLLIVDDDRALSPMIEEYLSAKGYEVTLCHNATEGFKNVQSKKIDLCILDIRMPMKDGFELAKEIIEHSPNKPFLFLTSESDKKKRIEGLKLGASDYIVKPFSMEELYLRIKLILKRTHPLNEFSTSEVSNYTIGKYAFDINSRELVLGKEIQKLSTIENQLLQLFCEAKDGFINREVALKQVWEDEHLLKTRSLNVYVSKLRKMLSEDSNISFQNVHGLGYRMAIK